jgi:hypothetical protein
VTKYIRIKQIKKYKLDEELQLLLNGELRYKSLQQWISQYPDILYNHLYLPGKMELVKVTITKTAYIEFKKSLAKKFPELFKQMILRQLKMKATPHLHSHLHAPQY